MMRSPKHQVIQKHEHEEEYPQFLGSSICNRLDSFCQSSSWKTTPLSFSHMYTVGREAWQMRMSSDTERISRF